ncbi:MAG: sulfite exporter TauE/SafE family protein [Thiohalocapsa sp.]|jgi:sulfite exporter TauE/SafE
MLTPLATAFVVGLLGGVHCVGMCGGVVSMLTLGIDPSRRRRLRSVLPLQLGYNLGRVAGYGLAGALAGGVGALLAQSGVLYWGQRTLYGLAALVMIALGLYLGGWWRGLAVVERGGAVLWRHIEPVGRRLLPIRSFPQALAVGLVWAWLPCGLVYSVLILALGAGSPVQGALLMLAFGLGTLPNLLGIGLLAGAAARYLEAVWLRRAAGLLVISFGGYALWQLLATG